MNNKFKGKEMEVIEQHHFVKKAAPIEPISDVQSFATASINDVSELSNRPTHSYDPYTFSTKEYSTFNSVREALETGNDSDLVAMPVGEVRQMMNRISLLENQVMKIKPNNVPEFDSFKKYYNQRYIADEDLHRKLTEMKKKQIEAEMNTAAQIERIRFSK
jgi:hypothetical protein